MRAVVVILALAVGVPTAGADPFQRCATRALAGEFGPLAKWQRHAYQRGLNQGVTVGPLVWLTRYGPWEGGMGTRGASGDRCSSRMLAANVLPMRTFVWIEGIGMRQVLDRGSRRNEVRARRKGCAWWADLWVPRRSNVSSKVRVAVIR